MKIQKIKKNHSIGILLIFLPLNNERVRISLMVSLTFLSPVLLADHVWTIDHNSWTGIAAFEAFNLFWYFLKLLQDLIALLDFIFFSNYSGMHQRLVLPASDFFVYGLQFFYDSHVFLKNLMLMFRLINFMRRTFLRLCRWQGLALPFGPCSQVDWRKTPTIDFRTNRLELFDNVHILLKKTLIIS